ncbi:MAG: DUF5615 family PIN-like protein [Nocardioidaceae bacterium]|nr:DUF5615 family PIN-like protein [Nocardioidaceae bacterium]
MNRALLLDEMMSPRIAEGRRARTIDANGIADRTDLHSLPDADVLELATAEERILVTFNIKDFQALDRLWATAGRTHDGIVFVAHRRFPRQGGAIGQLVTALEQLLMLPHVDAPQSGAICFL